MYDRVTVEEDTYQLFTLEKNELGISRAGGRGMKGVESGFI